MKLKNLVHNLNEVLQHYGDIDTECSDFRVVAVPQGEGKDAELVVRFELALAASAKKYQLQDGVIYDQRAVLYDGLDDWLDKAGQQVLCNLMNEGWDTTPFDEVWPILKERIAK